MDENYHGLTVIDVFCQGIMRSEETEQDLGKVELLHGGPPRRLFGEEFYVEVEDYPMVTTNGDFVIPEFKENEHN